MAATIDPTPHRLSRSGHQARTRTVLARVCSAISASRSWMRRPGPQAGRGGSGLDIPVGPQPQPPTGADQPRRGQAGEAVRGGCRGRRRRGRGVGVGRQWRPGRPSGGRSAAPTTPPAGRRRGAGRAGRGPGLRGPPGWRPGDQTWRRGGERPARRVQLNHPGSRLSHPSSGHPHGRAAGTLHGRIEVGTRSVVSFTPGAAAAGSPDIHADGTEDRQAPAWAADLGDVAPPADIRTSSRRGREGRERRRNRYRCGWYG